MKVKRDAFLYMEPDNSDSPFNFAQCASCQFWLPKKSRCALLGTTEVLGTMTCGMYVPGRPSDTQPILTDLGAVTVGLLNEQVRCENCAAYDPDSSVCKAYVTLNKRLGQSFDLDPLVDPHGCCNAWHSKED